MWRVFKWYYTLIHLLNGIIHLVLGIPNPAFFLSWKIYFMLGGGDGIVLLYRCHFIESVGLINLSQSNVCSSITLIMGHVEHLLCGMLVTTLVAFNPRETL